MRLRVLLTDGSKTTDLIWLEHNGTDIYFGHVGWPGKHSYHASGKRHDKLPDGTRFDCDQHHRLDAFQDQLQLCAFGHYPKRIFDSTTTLYQGKRSDSVLFLDSRGLPDFINISLGLVEVGRYDKLLPVHLTSDLLQVHLITSTKPWIYLMVLAPSAADLAEFGAPS